MSFYPSEFSTATTKYTGPLAIVSWDGPRNAENQMHGSGTIVFASGAVFVGDVVNDMLDGEGEMRDAGSSSVYKGGWVEDRREGRATFTTPYGSYEGQYLNNKRHGAGKETDAQGNVTEGEWTEGVLTRGKVSYSNGDIYIGQLNDSSERHGQGKLLTADGDVMDGQWVEDEFAD